MKFKLKLGKVGQAISKKINDFEAVELARARLKKSGLRIMPRPVDAEGKPLNPSLPINITEITSEELGDLFAEFAIMCQYAIQITASMDVETAARAKIDKYTRARVRLQKSGTVDDKAAKVEVDDRTRTSGFNLLRDESTMRLTEALLNSYQIGREVCSREMSRRQMEVGRQL